MKLAAPLEEALTFSPQASLAKVGRECRLRQSGFPTQNRTPCWTGSRRGSPRCRGAPRTLAASFFLSRHGRTTVQVRALDPHTLALAAGNLP